MENPDNANTDNQTMNVAYNSNGSTNNSNTENEIDESFADVVFNAFYRRSNFFARTFSRYLTRCFEIFDRGGSDIEEDDLMPWDLRIALRFSIHHYIDTKFLEKFLHTVNLENRCAEFRRMIGYELITYGRESTNSQFFFMSALHIYAAYDLKEMFGFTEAPDCAIEAVTHAMLLTKHKFWLYSWEI